MQGDEFKVLVTKYVGMHDEIAEAAKQMTALRKKKDSLGQLIVEFMRRSNIDECELHQGGKLVCRESKRTEMLKKEHIVAELMKVMSNDAARANASLENIYNSRNVEVKHVLSRTKR